MSESNSASFRSRPAGKWTVVCLILVVSIGLAAIASAGEGKKEKASAEDLKIPEGKQTTLGLYVTAAQAYEMWKAAPDAVKIIDVRTPRSTHSSVTRNRRGTSRWPS